MSQPKSNEALLRRYIQEAYPSGKIEELYDEVLAQKDAEVAEAVKAERERIVQKIAPFVSNRPLDDNDLQRLYPDQIRTFLTPKD